mmetsp:Transcript_16805/g.58634  ORF Transcript_16805/g.58634 Transcript_16805/m.58634 type:complete len:106 (+) Transcript_16805:136-453(+)
MVGQASRLYTCMQLVWPKWSGLSENTLCIIVMLAMIVVLRTLQLGACGLCTKFKSRAIAYVEGFPHNLSSLFDFPATVYRHSQTCTDRTASAATFLVYREEFTSR